MYSIVWLKDLHISPTLMLLIFLEKDHNTTIIDKNRFVSVKLQNNFGFWLIHFFPSLDTASQFCSETILYQLNRINILENLSNSKEISTEIVNLQKKPKENFQNMTIFCDFVIIDKCCLDFLSSKKQRKNIILN